MIINIKIEISDDDFLRLTYLRTKESIDKVLAETVANKEQQIRDNLARADYLYETWIRLQNKYPDVFPSYEKFVKTWTGNKTNYKKEVKND